MIPLAFPDSSAKQQIMNTPDQNKKDQQEKDFPGYPSYPASEDITGNASKVKSEEFGSIHKRTDTNSPTNESAEQRAADLPKARNAGDTIDPDTDVTEEDLAILAATTQNRDMDDPDEEETLLDATDDDGDPLNEPMPAYTQKGADLDVPGSETDDGNENIGEEDEENNYYSLGGDRHENLEEDATGT